MFHWLLLLGEKQISTNAVQLISPLTSDQEYYDCDNSNDDAKDDGADDASSTMVSAHCCLCYLV